MKKILVIMPLIYFIIFFIIAILILRNANYLHTFDDFTEIVNSSITHLDNVTTSKTEIFDENQCETEILLVEKMPIETVPIETEPIETEPLETTIKSEPSNVKPLVQIRLEMPKLNDDNNKITVSNSTYTIPKVLYDNLQNTLNSYSIDKGFCAISLFDQTVISYNSSDNFWVASSIKGPFGLFVCKQIDNKKFKLTDTFEYNAKHHSGNCGPIQYSEYGTTYTVEKLLQITIHESDNDGFLMLQDYFGFEGYNKMLEDLGCKTWLNGNIKWGYYTPRDLATIWLEIYNYSKEYNTLGKWYLDLLVNAKFNFISKALGHYTKVAHKSGFNPDYSYLDAAIVFGDSSTDKRVPNNYIVVIATGKSNDTNKYCLASMARAIDDIMVDLKAWQK